MMIPVVLSGGSGSRLWPLSRKNYPKQFLSLVDDETMLQSTLGRVSSIDDVLDPIIVCNNDHRFIVEEQLEQCSVMNASIILEPVGRNTAPAIALAAFEALKRGGDPVLLVLAADHVVLDPISFCAVIESARESAEHGSLVTFGITPSSPETGYGYIKCGSQVQHAYRVDQFVEKPDLITAKEYLESEQYLWNSGIFMFKASCYINELKKHRSDIADACERSMSAAYPDLGFVRVDEEEFALCPSDSIDYAVMEKADNSLVVPLSCGWSDVGGYSALLEVQDKDNNGNSCSGDVMQIDTSDCFISSEDKLIATIGVSDLVVVDTKDALLVAHKDRAQDVGKVAKTLANEGRAEADFHREVFRPWGSYDSIGNGSRYQVKRITVKPGAKLSVQMHHHRAEHWIVVSGTAKVTNGDKTILLSENQSTYIPVGVVHALENPGVIPLELIEVQSGSYLGEDDIVRLEDRYGRS